ncbi:MAG: DUF4621 domain-containing protein [Bacteroidales bacterium]
MKKNVFIVMIRNGQRIFLLSILLVSFLFTGCKKNEYDLSKGIDTEATVGGDSLLISIGKTLPVRLDSMINRQNIELLKKSANGEYSLQKGDSIAPKNVPKIDPVTIKIDPISVNPSVVSFTDLKFPTFVIDPISSSSAFNTPSFVLSKGIDPVNVLTKIPLNFASKVVAKAGGQRRTMATFSVGPFLASKDSSFNQVINIPTFPIELKKVDKIYLRNNIVTITFNKKLLNDLNLVSKTELLKIFRIDFPSEYGISNAVGINSRIEGNSFIIENAILPSAADSVTYSFQLDYLNTSNILQNGNLVLSRNVPFSFSYQISGEVNNIGDLTGKSANLSLSIKTAPTVYDLDIESKQIVVSMDAGSKNVDKVITGIPTDVSHISSVTFEDGAYISLNVSDPKILPFALSNGYVEINLPKTFVFKPSTDPNFNTSTNVLKMPYSSLFTTKRLDVQGLNINKDISKGSGSFELIDALTYKGVNLTLDSIKTSLLVAQGLGVKNVNLTADFVNFKVSNAAVTTNAVTAVVPSKTSNININKFISKDLLKIYNIGLTHTSNLTLHLDITGLPAEIDSLFFKNYVITFPSSMVFKSGTVNAKNQIVLNRGFKVSRGLPVSLLAPLKLKSMRATAETPVLLDSTGFNVNKGFTKVMTLEKFDFAPDGITLTDGNFVLNESVSLSGSIRVKGASLNTKDVGSITVKPSITIDDITVGSLEGQVSPTIDPISQSVKLALPDFLKQSGTNLAIVNPMITLEIGNSTGIPVDLNMDLIPKRNGVVIPNATVNTSMTVSAASKLGQLTWSKFWLSPKDTLRTAGFNFVSLTNLPTLLKTVPDEIEIKVNAAANQSQHHYIDLQSAVNQIKVKYNFNVPLSFDKDFELSYTDVVSNLKKDLVDVVKYAKQVQLIAVITNSIPLNLTLNLTLLDSNKNPIPTSEIEITQMGTIKSCNIADKSASVNNLNLGFKEIVAGSLSKLDAISFHVSAKATSSVIPLNASQTIGVSFKVKIPNGLTITEK